MQYDKVFVPTPDALFSGLESIANFYDKASKPQKHLILIPETFIFQWKQYARALQPWDEEGIEEFKQYILENQIRFHSAKQADFPLMEEQGLYLRIVKNNGEDKDIISVLRLLEEQTKKEFEESHKSHIFNIVSADSTIRAKLTLHNFNVEEIQHKNVDPVLAQKYIITLEPEQEEIRQALIKGDHKNQIPKELVGDLLNRDDSEFFTNQYLLFANTKNLSLFDGYRLNDQGVFVKRDFYKNVELLARVWQPIKRGGKNGVHPTNTHADFSGGQLVFLDMAYDPQIEAVAIVGKSGTGKTSLAYCTGLSIISNAINTARSNDQMYLLKSLTDVDSKQQIGFEPGSREEKLQGKYGSFKLIHSETLIDRTYSQLLKDPRSEEGKLVIGGKFNFSHTYPPLREVILNDIRGYTVNNLLLVDETQNFDPKHVRDIATRIGPHGVALFAGDTITQIDHPRYDENYNALSALVHEFIGQPWFGAVHLTQSYRSKMAARADNWKTY